MRRFFDCFLTGKCLAQREEGVDRDHPFGYNEFLNYIHRHQILTIDPNNRDTSTHLRILAHPIFSGTTFEWQTVMDGTQNQAEANFLGRGNFGPVFRCDIQTCESVGAAKFQDVEDDVSHKEFMAELILHRADHVNVIKLLGKSFGRNRLALIYEYMPGGSLDRHLLANVAPVQGLAQNHQVLDWEMRMRIAVGVARGLVYVHNELKMVHRDVKVQNILLDQEFVPKLTDFGLAVQIVEAEDGREIERLLDVNKGTPGCAAPEIEQYTKCSSKSDVYSYGVFLFQLITGRKAYDTSDPPLNMTDWMRRNCAGEENLPNVLDAALNNRYSVEGLNSLYATARMCTQPEAKERPNMAQVMDMVLEAAAHVVPGADSDVVPHEAGADVVPEAEASS